MNKYAIKRYNDNVYNEIKQYLNKYIDVSNDEFIMAINHHNCGSDEDFLIDHDEVEWRNLGINDFEVIIDGRELSSKQIMYIDLYQLSNFRYELERFNFSSMKDYLEGYELI